MFYKIVVIALYFITVLIYIRKSRSVSFIINIISSLSILYLMRVQEVWCVCVCPQLQRGNPLVWVFLTKDYDFRVLVRDEGGGFTSARKGQSPCVFFTEDYDFHFNHGPIEFLLTSNYKLKRSIRATFHLTDSLPKSVKSHVFLPKNYDFRVLARLSSFLLPVTSNMGKI